MIKLTRIDANRISVVTPSGLDITLFANEQVPIDRGSIAEIATISGIASTVQYLNGLRYFGDVDAVLRRAVLTPDFHKGPGIPIGTVLDVDGFVLPRCAGSDIGCGMRLIMTDIHRDEFDRMVGLDAILRYRFFEG